MTNDGEDIPTCRLYFLNALLANFYTSLELIFFRKMW